MRKPLFTLTALSFFIATGAQAAPKVAVDIAPLHSLVSQVMAGVGEPELLIPAEVSPHHHTLRPSEAKALADAELVFWMGESFTPWLEKSIDNLASSATVVEALEIEGITSYPFREGATFASHDHHDHGEEAHHDEHDHEGEHHEHDHHDEHGHDDHHDDHKDEHHEHEHKEHHDEHDHEEHGHKDEHHEHEHDEHHDEHDHHGHKDEHDHEEEHDHDEHHDEHEGHEGHDHEGADPHAWLDPENAKVWVNSISNTLAEKDPENAATYRANAEKTITSLDALIASISSRIDALGEPQFIVFHDAYQYFEKRFDIAAAGSIALADAEDPSPARIREIQNTVASLGVKCVYTEPQYNPGIVKNVFNGSSITTIGVMDPLGSDIATGADHYQALIEAMADSIAECQ